MRYDITAPAPTRRGPIDEHRLITLEPLAALSAARRAELVACCTRERVPAGLNLFREGERDDCAIYLLRGELLLTGGGPGPARLLAVARNGDNDALRHPIADKQPRQASAMTLGEAEILRLDYDSLDVALLWDQYAHFRSTCGGAVHDGLARLQRVLPLRAVPPERIDDLFACLEPVAVKAGQMVVREGEAGGDYYIIAEGEAAQIRETDRRRRAAIVPLGPGASFGEEALDPTGRYGASVAMTTPGRLWRLARADYAALTRAGEPPWIEARDALARADCGRAQWLDVRHPAEHSHDRIPGAQLAPLQHLGEALAELDPDRDYLCYCNTGRRAAAAAALLRGRGFRAAALRDGLHALPAP